MTFTSPLRATVLASAALLATAAMAQQALVPAQSSIQFSAKQLGVPVSGHFKQFSAQVHFDTAKPETSKIHFTVDTGSATMGSKETDSNLFSADWFNVAKFPKATFDSSAVRRLDASRFEVAGRLSIKGVGSDVVVPVTLARQGAQTVATGAFPIRRLQFRIGENEWADTAMVADEVQVKFRLVLTGVAPL